MLTTQSDLPSPEAGSTRQNKFRGGETVSPLARWAWVPIPLLVLAMLALWMADLRSSFDPPWLLFTLNFLFATLASAVITYLVSRSFLVRGTPGLLLLNCGVVFWGLAGVTSAAVGGTNYNASLTIHNVCAWFSAFCHLTGVVLSNRPRRRMVEKGWWLLGGFLGTVSVVTFVSSAAVKGWTPVFFVQGEGGTLVRYLVLGTTAGMFVLSAVVLRASNNPAHSTFSRWYGFALLSFAAAMFGLMLQSVHGSALGWTARSTQWIGGLYLIAATLVAARESRDREISLAFTPSDIRMRYALAIVFVAAALVLRLVFLQGLGTRLASVTFFPAVILATLYGGRGPGLLATLLATLTMDFFWMEPVGNLAIANRGDWLIVLIFLASSIIVVWVTGAMQQAQARVLAAESELKLAAERQRGQEALRQSEARFRSYFELGLIGMTITSPAKEILEVNDEICKILGYQRGELLRMSWTEITHPDDLAADIAQFNRVLAGEIDGYSMDKRWIRKCGKIIYSNVSIKCLRRADGSVDYFVALLQDITERRRTEVELRQAHEQLASRAVHLETLVQERTAKLKDMINELEHVSYAITHDMRAPLRAMSMFATALSEWAAAGGGSSAEAQDYSHRILVAASRLDKLIQDALHYTKATLQEMPLQSVDLTQLLRGLVESYPNLQPDRADIRIEGELPVVQGNEALLTQCFSNLLGNAVKFVEPEIKPAVRVRAESRNGAVRIWVEDNGIGIPAHAQDRLFGMFQKLDNSYEGTGIGLAIVRKVAERMGGRVGVESEPKKGSRFWVELQIASNSAKAK